MNGVLDRQLVAQAVIIVAACVGGWMMLVEPRLKEAARLEAEIAAAQGAAGTAAGLSQEVLVARLAGSRQRLASIQRRNALAADSSRLYGLIMDLATTHGIEVQRLHPGGDRSDRGGAGVWTSRIEMSVQGEFEALASFLRAVPALEGFLRPAAMQVSPLDSDGRRLVQAQLTFEALRFEPGEVLAQLEETDDHPQP